MGAGILCLTQGRPHAGAGASTWALEDKLRETPSGRVVLVSSGMTLGLAPAPARGERETQLSSRMTIVGRPRGASVL
jgi:hypothetical protein